MSSIHPPTKTWRNDLAQTIFSISFSTIIFLPIGMTLALLISWVFSLMNLYSWLATQPEVIFWVVFATIVLVGISFIMIQVDSWVEKNIIEKVKNENVRLTISVIGFIVIALLLYFVISWYINFLNLNFWLT